MRVPLELLHVGFGNMVVARRVMAILVPDSLPIRRLVREAREQGRLLDASRGRKVRAILVLDDGVVVASALHPSTIARRLEEKGTNEGA